MSMPALLSHFGVNTSRYVTTTGQIVFNGATKVGATFTHADHGVVTPVVRHTFHGGVDEPEEHDGPAEVWWADKEQVDRHIESMETAFPGFFCLPPDGGAGPCWAGIIDTGRGSFKIGIFARRDQGLPRIVIFDRHLGVHAGRRWQPSPHLYTNGNPCIADQGDWDAAQHTVATAAAWAAHWLAAYTEWRMTRRWPAEGVQAVAS